MYKSYLFLCLGLLCVGCSYTSGNYKPPSIVEVRSDQSPIIKYSGKPVIIHFWATWCPTCIYDLPNFLKTAEIIESQGVQVATVAVEDSREKVERFFRIHESKFDVIVDDKSFLATMFGVGGLPVTMLLDGSGQPLHFRHPLTGEVTDRFDGLVPWGEPWLTDFLKKLSLEAVKREKGKINHL